MNTKTLFAAFLVAVGALLLFRPAARGYPPAPSVLIYGLAKDQYGQPLSNPADLVVLRTSNGVQIVGSIQPNLAIGVNYAVQVPMDSGAISPPYVSNALTAGTPYKLYVVVGGTTNLPIEMTGAYSLMVAPAQKAVQNLNLGSDVNGDGIPDAWELAFLASLGLNVPLGSINPNADYAHDGHSLRQEYALGNYPYQPNAFAVNIISVQAGSAVLAFTATAGRTYTTTGSPDLINWTPLSFTTPSNGTNLLTSFYSTEIQPLQIQTVQPGAAPQLQFFRVQFQ